jgi:hypothetical protein
LGEALEKPARKTRYYFPDIIDEILRLSEGKDGLRSHVGKLLAINSEAEMLAQLGEGLVLSLRLLD